MESTVGHLVMARRPGFRNARQLLIGVDVTGPGAVLQLAEVVLQAIQGLVMSLGFERARMAAAASGTVGGKLPGGFVAVAGMAAGAFLDPPVISGIPGRGVRELHWYPARIVMARGAVQRRRHVIGDFAGCSCSVVTALTVSRDPGMVEARRCPGERAVAGAALLCRGEVIAGHRGGLNA